MPPADASRTRILSAGSTLLPTRRSGNERPRMGTGLLAGEGPIQRGSGLGGSRARTVGDALLRALGEQMDWRRPTESRQRSSEQCRRQLPPLLS